MIADLLSSAVPVASDILERTASTPRVQQIVSLSLAPAFLHSGHRPCSVGAPLL